MAGLIRSRLKLYRKWIRKAAHTTRYRDIAGQQSFQDVAREGHLTARPIICMCKAGMGQCKAGAYFERSLQDQLNYCLKCIWTDSTKYKHCFKYDDNVILQAIQDRLLNTYTKDEE